MYVCLYVCLSGYAFRNAWTDFDETLCGRSCGHGTLHNALNFFVQGCHMFLNAVTLHNEPDLYKTLGDDCPCHGKANGNFDFLRSGLPYICFFCSSAMVSPIWTKLWVVIVPAMERQMAILFFRGQGCHIFAFSVVLQWFARFGWNFGWWKIMPWDMKWNN